MTRMKLASRISALALLVATPTFAAPFIVSDADPTGASDKCVYQEGTAPPVVTNTVVTPPALTGNCKIDLAGVTTGTHNYQIWFRSSLYGTDSAKVPFGFAKPAAGGIGPQNLRVEP